MKRGYCHERKGNCHNRGYCFFLSRLVLRNNSILHLGLCIVNSFYSHFLCITSKNLLFLCLLCLPISLPRKIIYNFSLSKLSNISSSL
ncbi:hypothetical protein GCWU000342_00547 [Shuttleworthella satelles DSM 14600]|uniref:Uncharacterized protein n=1 Tax=Shuttleworthella satelles DSM 14600 TaxID=626523 RepID=C4G996_9FIRM|nr:hypothetical protein GCWU000342_00547 [Shuttleworthia satelles DSM 14600]